jgi:hypothetical protein
MKIKITNNVLLDAFRHQYESIDKIERGLQIERKHMPEIISDIIGDDIPVSNGFIIYPCKSSYSPLDAQNVDLEYIFDQVYDSQRKSYHDHPENADHYDSVRYKGFCNSSNTLYLEMDDIYGHHYSLSPYDSYNKWQELFDRFIKNGSASWYSQKDYFAATMVFNYVDCYLEMTKNNSFAEFTAAAYSISSCLYNAILSFLLNGNLIFVDQRIYIDNSYGLFFCYLAEELAWAFGPRILGAEISMKELRA